MATPRVYQRVGNTSSAPSDYDVSVGQLSILFDGIDDALQTNSIDFTATDKMTVFAGVRKLSDAQTTALVELSESWVAAANTGTFVVHAPHGILLPTFYSGSRGTAAAGSSLASIKTENIAPKTAVLASTHNIAGNLTTLRVNNISASDAIASKGTGNFGNYPLYIGARAGNSLFFNGHLYSLIARGAQSTAAQIESTEQWVNGKTAAF